MRGVPYAVVLLVAACAVLAAVTYRLYDPDLWQHLTVGREIWRTHAIPSTQLWTWPTHGAPDVLPSWLFRALLWPFWSLGGEAGIFVWRWLTTLMGFALLLWAARRAGATGVVPLLALLWCALLWRQRSQARPETLVLILISAQLLLFEARRAARAGGRASAHAWGFVPLALVWANAHISYYLGFVIASGYLLDDLLHTRRGGRWGLVPPMLAGAAASFVNPFGWQVLAQPFLYFLVWRHEPIYKTIGELQPVDWTMNVTNGLPLFLPLLVVAAVLRWRKRGIDGAQLAILMACLPQALTTQRFVGYLAVCAAPFFARDLGEWAAAWRWPATLRAPGRRALVASLACVAMVVPELTRPGLGLGYGFVWNQYPVRACDWIEKHGVRGRAFNPFSYGGYLLWRFYPDSTRLPFMDIHQAGTPRIRREYAYVAQDSLAWRVLDARWRFDWVLMMRGLSTRVGVLDFLDADSDFALVFADDVATIYLRRDGRDSTLARQWGYRLMPGGSRAIGALGERAWQDPAVRVELDRELARAIASSEWNGHARALAANIALQDGRYEDAANHLERAIRLETQEQLLHGRLGIAQLMRGHAAEALAEFETEHRANSTWDEYDLRRGQALLAMGRRAEAQAAFVRAREVPATSAEAGDSLAALESR